MTQASESLKIFPDDEIWGDVAPTRYLRFKRYLSPVLAALLLVPCGLLLLPLMAMVRFTSKGPAILRQQRVGIGGRVYTMYKLRSMYEDAETRTGPVWSQRHDPRITPVGRVLRSLHLDEIPQLINVLRGEMTLVGPRPERPQFVEVLADEIPGYVDRLSVLPGITGLAQIHLPPDVSIDCVRRKLILDLHYIETANILVDLRVIACTAVRMFGVKGLMAARLLGFRYPHRLLRPAELAADREVQLSTNERAGFVTLSELEQVLSTGAHRIAAASPHLFGCDPAVPVLETAKRRAR